MNIIKPITRFANDWETIGALRKVEDTRTAKELVDTIKAYANNLQEVKNVLPELLEMNPKHLGFAADTIELSNGTVFSMTNVDFKKPVKDGKNLLAFILEKLPKASKENPYAIDLAQEVINTTDKTNSKYFLARFINGLEMPELAQQFKAAKELVYDIAKGTIDGPYTGNFSKQENFVKMLGSITSPNSKPEKISMLKKVSEKIGSISDHNYEISINQFANSDVPVAKISDNLETMTQIARMAEAKGKFIDPVEYLLNNTNLY